MIQKIYLDRFAFKLACGMNFELDAIKKYKRLLNYDDVSKISRFLKTKEKELENLCDPMFYEKDEGESYDNVVRDIKLEFFDKFIEPLCNNYYLMENFRKEFYEGEIALYLKPRDKNEVELNSLRHERVLNLALYDSHCKCLRGLISSEQRNKEFIKNKVYHKENINLKLQDSLFYNQGDQIMDFEYKHYQISVFVNGEKRIFNKDHTEHDWDLGRFGIETQEQLDKAIENGDIDVCDNNWFEFAIFDNDSGEEITENGDTVLGDLNDALDINKYIDFIEEYEKELETEKEVEEEREDEATL